ncbi:sodium channel protein Nach-like [Tribolium castaneum]|uniref:sodium channel protein Nach-like n=1 Tax=Tribolium castaneum TaxID=7070 RepID=UPI00077D9770|nr:PREDICTED: sodium channel protein Nach-like [Tribolium castaneum]|eukprot:XP_015840939.1 PREDICTED: sodium channel protein Nach-like [Tribolium castaneum]
MYTKRKVNKNTRFSQSLKDHVIFTLSSASMHGLIHAVRSNRLLFERFLWIGLVIGAFSVATYQALQAWNRYDTSPVVITIEKDFFNWETEFPAVFFCARAKLTTAYKFLKIFRNKYNISASVEQLEGYVDDLLFTTYENYSSLEKYANGSQDDFVPTDLYLELVNFTSFRIPKNSNKTKIKYSEWPKNVNGEYSFVLTEFGFCQCFHSKVAGFFNIDNFTIDGATNTTFLPITKKYKEPALTLSQSDFSQTNFLFVIGTNEIIDITSQYFVVTPQTLGDVFLDIVDIVGDEDIKMLSPKQRNCRYWNEADDLGHSRVYSYNLCRRECRIQLCLKFCYCTPYYYKRIDNEPICNMSGMFCLSKYPEILTLLDPKTGEDLCPCFQSCDFQRITAELTIKATWFFGSKVTVNLERFPRERYKRTLIFTRTDLLIQIGSLFGLFLGCSVLSLIEIPYFLTLRFFWGVFGNRRIKPRV